MSDLGNLYVISAPSGTGKTTLVKALIESISGITVSISHTTRPKRPTEMHGVNYYFVSKSEFQRMIDQNDFFEHATIFDHLYGTSQRWVEETLAKGLDVILEIDWQGCQQIKKLFPKSISIFVLPPSIEALSERLKTRNQDKPDVLEKRLADARKTILHSTEYDYLVVNDNFNHALNDLKTIILAGRLIEPRQCTKLAKIIDELTQR